MPSDLVSKLHLALPEQQRASAVEILKQYRGQMIPYYWGGDDFYGLDCSGFVVLILQSVGILGHRTDYTANDLAKKFIANRVCNITDVREGCLVFWLNQEQYATHVEMLADPYHVVGASGGGRPRFDLYNEVQGDEFLKAHYGHLSKRELRESKDFILRWVKRELYKEQAMDMNAFVQQRPIDYRGRNIIICDPFMDKGEDE